MFRGLDALRRLFLKRMDHPNALPRLRQQITLEEAGGSPAAGHRLALAKKIEDFSAG
jgi:hypothetical protein